MTMNSNSHHLSPLFYICVLSEYNLPQLEAILARKPSDLLFVVSDFEPARKGADNLSILLEEQLPGICIHRPDQQTDRVLNGDDLLNAQQWAADILVPYIVQRADGKPCWLNLTGGTKTVSLALTAAYDWDQLDYKPAAQSTLYGFHLQTDQPAGEKFSAVDQQVLPAVTPQQVVRTYNRNIQEKPANPMRSNGASLPLAEALFAALDRKDPALMQIFDALSRIWSYQRDHRQWKKALLTLPLSEFLQCTPDEYYPDLTVWLQRLQQLDASCFRLEGEILTLPGNKPKRNKASRDFRAWLSGDWLEQLTGYWLTSGDDALPASSIAYGIKAGDMPSKDELREADLLIHYQGKTHIIEVKADLPPNSQSKSAAQQVGSQHAFGRANRLLMVGPEFRHRLNQNNDWLSFRERCADNKIQVCSNRDELLKALNLKKA